MSNQLLARALGRCLSALDGLSAAYLPDSVSEETAEAIVRSANARRPAEPPFAILVSAGLEVVDDRACLRLTPQNAIRYRQGDRLAVVTGRHPDLASFVQAFREVLGQSYPAGAGGAVSLAAVAREGLVGVLDVAGASPESTWNRAETEARLACCFEYLSDAHAELRQGSRGWNAYWFEHVTMGLDNLAAAMRAAVEYGSAQILNEFFAKFTYASFALPTPKGRVSLAAQAPRAGKAIAEALSNWWSDEQTIGITIRQLEHHPDTSPLSHHPLSSVSWAGFDRRLAEMDNGLLAILDQVSEPARTEHFSALTEPQFFDPFRRRNQTRQLVVYGDDGRDLSMSTSPESGPFLLTSSLLDPRRVKSEPVCVEVPLTACPTEEQVRSSKVELECSGQKISWKGALELVDGRLWFSGHFLRDVESPSYLKPLLVTSLGLLVTAEDSLAGVVDPSASCTLYVMPHAGTGLMFLKANRRGELGRATYVGEERVTTEGKGESTIYAGTFDDAASKYQVIIWGETDQDARWESKSLPELKGRAGIWASSLTPNGIDTFESGASIFELRSPESKGSCQSPIVAAIDKRLVSGERPGPETEQSVRGFLESQIADGVGRDDWMKSLGHVVLPSDIDMALEDLTLHDGALLMNATLHPYWSTGTSFRVPDSFATSAAAEEFRRAFAGLGVAEALDLGAGDSETRGEWPSRTSWRHLWRENRADLDKYLEAYIGLVAAARESGDKSALFWATYPFSASIWAAKSSGKCVAVMLSPLHPLRLAWLASVESTLWDAPNPGQLAGTIEGWNFPLFGPRETSHGRMVAIPTDSGEGQLFLGWSMLVEASIDGEQPLLAPVKVGNLSAPGSAASGLNATAAAAALRSYKKMHPHVTTLTVDLAAWNKTARLQEVDRAVLAAVTEWTKPKDSALPGGVRVWDSLNRGGAVPKGAVNQLARSASGAPITWARYMPDPVESKQSNIRMLQDSGVRIEVGTSSKPNLGLVGEVPLRRFEALEPPLTGSASSESRPAVPPGAEAAAFVRALGAAENASKGPRIVSRLFNSALLADEADWTVSGEALMSPSAMSSLAEKSGTRSQMLWEWRPPFLEASEGVPVLERRPFVSIARVPGSFRQQIRTMLDKAYGRPASDLEVTALLGTLGARGVGLSSLVSMGGTHAVGALGFYLAFSLMARISSDETEEFVIPIDACDSFLKALAGVPKHGEATRRADLLVIRLDERGVTLTPIEIKLHGFMGLEAAAHLPRPGEAPFNEPLDQLASTFDLLMSLQGRSTALRGENSASRALWLNGLTSLVEAGARLQPRGAQSSPNLRTHMASLVSGELPLRIGRPIVMYFRHLSTTLDGKFFEALQGQTSDSHPSIGEFASLASQVGSAFTQAHSADSPLVQSWRSMVNWSADNATADVFQDQASEAVLPQLADPLTSYEEDLQVVEEQKEVNAPKNAAAPSFGPFGQGSRLTPEEATSSVSKPEHLVESSRAEVSERHAQGVRFPVGRILNSLGAAPADFWPSNTALNQMNIGVVGDLGTGKTQLLKALIYKLRRGAATAQGNPLSVLILDYKRDFQDLSFLKAVGGQVLRPQRIPLNIFALADGYSPLAAFQKAKSFCDVIGKIYAGVGPVQRDRLINVITQIFKDQNGRPPTLAQVGEAYRQGIKADSVVGILNTFVLGEVFGDDPDELRSFQDLMHDRVLVLAVNELGADQESKNALVALFLNIYYEYMLKVPKWPYAGRSPQLRKLNSFLLVDEAVNIMRYEFPALMDVMLQGREFGVGTILASQYLSHFRTTNANYGEPLLTWFIHKVPHVTIRELEQLGIRDQPPSVLGLISELRVHEALYSSLGYKGAFVRGTPFYEVDPAAPTAT